MQPSGMICGHGQDSDSSIWLGVLWGAARKAERLNHNAALSDGIGGALWLPILLEEGCHSAGFDTTIHKRHHLLLSLGWRFNLFAPE